MSADLVFGAGFRVVVSNPQMTATVVPTGGKVVVLAASGSSAALDAHVSSTRPHEAAESGRDFAAWFNAQITT